MLRFSEILDFLVYSNIYISLGAASFTYVFFKVIGIPVNNIIVIPFVIMFAIYTFNRKTDKKEDELSDEKKAAFNNKYNKYILTIAIVSYTIVTLVSFLKGVVYGIAILTPFIIGILYSGCCIPINSKKKRLKDIFFLKNFVVAITWAYTTVILPSIFLNIALTQEIYFLSYIVFLRILIGTIFFDIKDVKGDKSECIKTIPVVYGVNFTNKLILFLNATFTYTVISFYKFNLQAPLLLYVGLFTSLYGFFYIYLQRTNFIEINKLSNVIVDGEYIATGVITHLATSL